MTEATFHALNPLKGWVQVRLDDGEILWVLLESFQGVREHDLNVCQECCQILYGQQKVLRNNPDLERVRICPRILTIKNGPHKIDFLSEILYPVQQGGTIPQTPEELLPFFTRRMPKDLQVLGEQVELQFSVCMVFGGESQVAPLVHDPMRYQIYEAQP